MEALIHLGRELQYMAAEVIPPSLSVSLSDLSLHWFSIFCRVCA